MSNRLIKILGLICLIPVLIAACSASPSINPKTTSPVAGAQNSAAPAVEGGEGSAEAALVTYSDSQQGFSINYPGPWT